MILDRDDASMQARQRNHAQCLLELTTAVVLEELSICALEYFHT
jgi:hypothetical protein